METAITELSASALAERRRLGLDLFDEVWDGVLHVQPAPHLEHSRVAGDLYGLLLPIARAAGLDCAFAFGIYRPNLPGHRDYRVPDLSLFHPEHGTDRGIEGRAELVIEIASPGDESYAKVPFYAGVGVQELLIIDRDTKAITRWSRDGTGTFAETAPDADGWHHLHAVPISLRAHDGELTARTPDGSILLQRARVVTEAQSEYDDTPALQELLAQASASPTVRRSRPRAE